MYSFKFAVSGDISENGLSMNNKNLTGSIWDLFSSSRLGSNYSAFSTRVTLILVIWPREPRE
jgi:hypothetical protein